MRMIAFDAGFTTGYAVIARGDAPITGSYSVDGSAAELGRAVASFIDQMHTMLKAHRPDAVALAKPFIGIRNIAVVEVLFGFWAGAKLLCYRLGIPCYTVHEPDARRAFLGGVPRKSKDIKAQVMAECLRRDWYICDDHAADALVVALHKLDQLEPGASWTATALGLEGQRRHGKPKRARKPRSRSVQRAAA